jgi:hypothetical protein
MTAPAMPEAALAELRRAPAKRLFALVDAAHGASVYGMLLRLPADQCASLYQERRGAQSLAYSAPHLVEVGAAVLPELAGWWGAPCVAYVFSALPFAQLRKHFRKFLLVRARGKTVYFRFYDPRILPTFLLNATGAELEAFGAGIDKFLVERDGGHSALLFERDASSAQTVLRHRELRDDAQSGLPASTSR